MSETETVVFRGGPVGGHVMPIKKGNPRTYLVEGTGETTAAYERTVHVEQVDGQPAAVFVWLEQRLPLGRRPRG